MKSFYCLVVFSCIFLKANGASIANDESHNDMSVMTALEMSQILSKLIIRGSFHAVGKATGTSYYKATNKIYAGMMNEDPFQDNPSQNGSDNPVDIGQCFPTPCRFFGVCVNTGGNSYRCDCLAPFTGKRCSELRCYHIPGWPKLIPQPLYRTCRSSENICVLRRMGLILRPTCTCADPDNCSGNDEGEDETDDVDVLSPAEPTERLPYF